MDNKYRLVSSDDICNLLQAELTKIIKGQKIPNNPEGLSYLEKQASQISKDILPCIVDDFNIEAESIGEHEVHWKISDNLSVTEKENK